MNFDVTNTRDWKPFFNGSLRKDAVTWISVQVRVNIYLSDVNTILSLWFSRMIYNMKLHVKKMSATFKLISMKFFELKSSNGVNHMSPNGIGRFNGDYKRSSNCLFCRHSSLPFYPSRVFFFFREETRFITGRTVNNVSFEEELKRDHTNFEVMFMNSILCNLYRWI